MTSPADDASTLVGDEERDSGARRLRDAYAEGRLTREDMDARLDGVLSATTRGELAAALASLPAEDPGTTTTIGAAAGRVRRSGPWRVPRTLRVESAYGRVQLDLSRAVIEHPVVDIVLNVGTGKAAITVPHDAAVDLDGLTTGYRDVVYKPPRRPATGGPTIRITGVMGFGRLTVRHARR
ncbi:DUF1707 domain-containing protein [Streptomyces sp. WMMC500]|uniref:DUF1707 SHOCT-like domain-containing protein n=1 Tax=Streptomyces sp. WMMC500 TaxID=3015154 RepID=UPI00248AA0DE|nr:DUF1707 domain-containing protein [Streptomyces sp. WMMC500]WBB58704.1 DUF1707 domain-containing protein [Streptomyces sp. WMMC500]